LLLLLLLLEMLQLQLRLHLRSRPIHLRHHRGGIVVVLGHERLPEAVWKAHKILQ
jgi:hypothetical protein